jgi:hypothetical protein
MVKFGYVGLSMRGRSMGRRWGTTSGGLLVTAAIAIITTAIAAAPANADRYTFLELIG